MTGRYISAQKRESEMLKVFTVQVHGGFGCAMSGVDDPGRLLASGSALAGSLKLCLAKPWHKGLTGAGEKFLLPTECLPAGRNILAAAPKH